MKNSILNRSMLSGENMALLAELKAQNDANDIVENNISNKKENIKPKKDELDILWQNFKISNREEKSPGIYILTGFIAGALSMFLMTAMLSITTFSNSENNTLKNERKIVKKSHGSFFVSDKSNEKSIEEETEPQITPEEVVMNTPAVINDKYTVKAGDSLEAISVKFYGKASPENTKKLQEANELASPHAIYAGQELLIPMS